MISATTQTQAPLQPTPLTPNTALAVSPSGPSFADLVDAINPLQHIPVVSSVYRAATGSTISPTAQVVGDTGYGVLLGGVVPALAASLANLGVRELTGKDIGQQAVAGLSALASSSSSRPQAVPLVASAGAVPPAPVPAPVSPLATALSLYQSSDRTLGNYQRAQVLGAVNQKLVKLVL